MLRSTAGRQLPATPALPVVVPALLVPAAWAAAGAIPLVCRHFGALRRATRDGLVPVPAGSQLNAAIATWAAAPASRPAPPPHPEGGPCCCCCTEHSNGELRGGQTAGGSRPAVGSSTAGRSGGERAQAAGGSSMAFSSACIACAEARVPGKPPSEASARAPAPAKERSRHMPPGTWRPAHPPWLLSALACRLAAAAAAAVGGLAVPVAAARPLCEEAPQGLAPLRPCSAAAALLCPRPPPHPFCFLAVQGSLLAQPAAVASREEAEVAVDGVAAC